MHTYYKELICSRNAASGHVLLRIPFGFQDTAPSVNASQQNLFEFFPIKLLYCKSKPILELTFWDKIGHHFSIIHLVTWID